MDIGAIFGSSQNTTAKTEKNNKTEEKKETSLWESFCNDVIAPAVEDGFNSYVDENFGTDLAEQKKKKEEEKELEDALKKEEEKKNQSFEDSLNDLAADCAEDLLYGYLDENCGTKLAEAKKEDEAKEKETLEKAHKMKEKKEAQKNEQIKETTDLLTKIFSSLFEEN